MNNKVNSDEWSNMISNIEREFREGLVVITDGVLRDAIAKRFENMEFALDEKGNPDGVKNHQEMVLTIADDIANMFAEIAYDKAQKALDKDDFLNVYANQLLEDSKEINNG